MSAEEKYGEGKEAERDDLDSSEDEMEGKEVDDAPFHCFVVDDAGFDLDCITMMCEECGFEGTGACATPRCRSRTAPPTS